MRQSFYAEGLRPSDSPHALSLALRAALRSRGSLAALVRSGCYNRGFARRVRRRFVVTGRVQGVGFRWFTHDAAAREGVDGWVKNLPDGRVEAEIEGEIEAVDRVEAALRRGPSASRVDGVDVDARAPLGRRTGFSIR